MKRLLAVTAMIEIPTGLLLLVVPSVVVGLLLGGELTGNGVPLGRLAGVALLALGVACQLGQYDAQTCAARGVASALVLYNFGAVVVLGSAGLRSASHGVILWPAVAIHVVMTAWCVATLLKKPEGKTK